MDQNPVRVRTITAGVEVSQRGEPERVEAAFEFLTRAKRSFESAGYEVQTLRVATNPWVAGVGGREREQLLPRIRVLDELAASRGGILSIGPVLNEDRTDASLPQWASELVRTTRAVTFSIVIAAPGRGVFASAAAVAAKTMAALACTLDGGMANFRFAAAANIPPGTPFVPVAWHSGAESMAVGLESASVVEQAFASIDDRNRATAHLKTRLDEVLAPIERIARAVAREAERVYLGIDTSPAPAKDRSIGIAIEALTRAPFGAAGTLEACGAITAALKTVAVTTCGYSGLMLPVLEDPLLARRAGEGRYGLRDLLLFSSVCGTGLDLVPIPGDTPTESIAAVLRDVATLSARLGKPLAARLFLVPGKSAGEIARFSDPLLTDSVVMKID